MNRIRNDLKYYEKYNVLLKEKRESRDKQILGNAWKELDCDSDKKPKLDDSSHEVVSEKVNYKLEMIYISYIFVFV
jgi:hypothetical protein